MRNRGCLMMSRWDDGDFGFVLMLMLMMMMEGDAIGG